MAQKHYISSRLKYYISIPTTRVTIPGCEDGNSDIVPSCFWKHGKEMFYLCLHCTPEKKESTMAVFGTVRTNC